MQEIKDILATLILFIIVSAVVSVSFIFMLVLIPLSIAGGIYIYVKDERNSQRLG
jgi:hypothetical protein